MRVLLLACAVLGLIASCSDEEATPIDLSGSGTTTTTAPDPRPDDGAGATGETDSGGDSDSPATTDAPAEGSAQPDGTLPPTPHAIGENPQARAYAEKQCQDDPALAQGVVRIVDPTTQRLVGEVVVDCAEVRAAPPG